MGGYSWDANDAQTLCSLMASLGFIGPLKILGPLPP